MSNYPVLNEMGVQNPGEIARYELYMVDHTDILRIVYDRKKGSILPVTRRYKFPQIKKSTMVDSGSRQTEVLYESSQEFRNAVSELDKLLDTKKDKKASDAAILEEIEHLEQDVAHRIAYLKSLLDK